jgi:hypothetical protein
MRDHRPEAENRPPYREKNAVGSFWQILHLFAETCRSERNLAWVLMALLAASTAFLLALNPILTHFK